MKTRTKVVVIGGGIAGCSTLYHLTKEGWSDVVLLERNNLTSGTTWHSAAQVTNFGMNQTMVGLKKHSIELYRDLANDPNFPVNYNYADGGIRLANTEEQMDAYRHFTSMGRGPVLGGGGGFLVESSMGGSWALVWTCDLVLELPNSGISLCGREGV